MKVFFTNEELSFLFDFTKKMIKVTESKNPKPHEEAGKLLVIHKTVLDKFKRTICLPQNEGTMDLNRNEAKSLRMQMGLSEKMMKLAKEAYDKKNEAEPPFSDSPGRRKVDYLEMLSKRIDIVKGITKKIEEGI